MLKKIRTAALALALTVAAGSVNSVKPELVVNGGQRRPGAALERTVVRAIFFGTVTRWNTGRAISVYVLPPDHPTTKAFAWDILRVTPHSFEERISAMIATRDGNPPKVLQTEAEMLQAIINTPNSIGYLSYSVVISNAHNRIRVISVF